jgi:type II secretory pathway pseudopilin PulG
MEVLIVVTLLAIFLVVGIAVYRKQIARAEDGQRQSDLEELTTAMEDFYNDHGCYPLPTQICYDADNDDTATCHICGREADPFFPLAKHHLPCNPDHPQKKYLYELENAEGVAASCPQWYRIYTELANNENNTMCPYSLCGPVGGYDYGVSSPNVDLEAGGDDLVGYEPSNTTCIHCVTMEECEQELQEGGISDIYVSEDQCCTENPNADNCVFYGWHHEELDCTVCAGTLNQCGPKMTIYNDSGEATWLEQCCADHPGADACQ